MEPILPYIDVLSKLSAPALVVLIVIFLTINHSKGEERDTKIYAAFLTTIQNVLDGFADSMRGLTGALQDHDKNAQTAIKGIANLEERMSVAQDKMIGFADHQDEMINSATDSVKASIGIQLTEIANRLVDLQDQVGQVSVELIALSSDLAGAERRIADFIIQSKLGDPHDRNPEHPAE